MKKALMIIAVFFAGAVSGLILSYGPMSAHGAGDDAGVMAKLDDITKGQQEIMASIESIKADLTIIKVRVTQLQ